MPKYLFLSLTVALMLLMGCTSYQCPAAPAECERLDWTVILVVALGVLLGISILSNLFITGAWLKNNKLVITWRKRVAKAKDAGDVSGGSSCKPLAILCVVMTVLFCAAFLVAVMAFS